ncbi:tyrosine-type recombinase/integrase, partial [Escherichia coli]
MRISEGLQLRVKDLDFDHGTIIVREGKGSKDRALMLPESLAPSLREQLSRARAWWLKGTVAKLAMRQPFVLFKGLTFQKLC